MAPPLYIRSFSERERERERERLKNLEELREGRTAGAGAEKQRVNGQRQISDDRSTAGVYRSLTEHRSRGRSPICDEGRASTATTSELRHRGDVTVGLLGFGFYLCIGDFFFLDKNLCLSVFAVFLSVCSVFGLLLSLVCC